MSPYYSRDGNTMQDSLPDGGFSAAEKNACSVGLIMVTDTSSDEWISTHLGESTCSLQSF